MVGRENMGIEEDDNNSFTEVPPINRNEEIVRDVLKLINNEAGSTVSHVLLDCFPNQEKDDVVKVTIQNIAR